MAFNRWLAACALIVATFASAQPAVNDAQVTSPMIASAVAAVRGGKPQEAIAQLDAVIAHFEAKYRKDDVRPYSADTQAEALLYMVQAATLPPAERKSAAVYSGNWAAAYYLKGYVFLELRRAEGARQMVQAAIDLAPNNAQYRNEMGSVYGALRDFEAAMQSFKEAERIARESVASQPPGNPHLGRALRGQGFIFIETKRLDDAERVYRQCLELNPNDKAAAGQLAYIQGLRSGAAPVAPQLFTPPATQ